MVEWQLPKLHTGVRFPSPAFISTADLAQKTQRTQIFGNFYRCVPSWPLCECTNLFPAEEFFERLEKFVRDVASFFSEVIELLRELHLFAAVYFARRGRNLVRWKINFIGSAGGFATSGREMI